MCVCQGMYSRHAQTARSRSESQHSIACMYKETALCEIGRSGTASQEAKSEWVRKKASMCGASEWNAIEHLYIQRTQTVFKSSKPEAEDKDFAKVHCRIRSGAVSQVQALVL